jgi:hypothetical protein
VAHTFDLVKCPHPTMDALQERLAFGTQSFGCRNFDRSRLVDARGVQKQLRCGLGWHGGGSVLIEREPDRISQSPTLARHDGLNIATRQLFRKGVDERKSNVSHARLSFANISRTLKTATVNIEIGPRSLSGRTMQTANIGMCNSPDCARTRSRIFIRIDLCQRSYLQGR